MAVVQMSADAVPGKMDCGAIAAVTKLIAIGVELLV
jgi:hypothetical protein